MERWISKHSIPPCFGGRYDHSCNMSSAYFSLNLWLRLIKPSSPFLCVWRVIFLQSPEQWCQLNTSSRGLNTSAPTNGQAWRWPRLHRLCVWKNGCERDSWGGTECFEAIVYVLQVSCNFFAVLNISCISLVYKLFINDQIRLFTVYVQIRNFCKRKLNGWSPIVAPFTTTTSLASQRHLDQPVLIASSGLRGARGNQTSYTSGGTRTNNLRLSLWFLNLPFNRNTPIAIALHGWPKSSAPHASLRRTHHTKVW